MAFSFNGNWGAVVPNGTDHVGPCPSYPNDPQAHIFIQRVDIDATNEYHGLHPDTNGYMIGCNNFGGVVFDDCDWNWGVSPNCYGMMGMSADLDTCHRFDWSTSYMHGGCAESSNPTNVMQYYMNWNTRDPLSLYANNYFSYPHLGTRP